VIPYTEPFASAINHGGLATMPRPYEYASADAVSILQPGTELGDLLDSIVQLAALVLNSRKVSLLLRQGREDEFIIARAIGLEPTVVAEARVKLGQFIAGWVAKTKRPLLVRDIRNDAELSDGIRPVAPTRYTTGSFMCVPVVVGGEARAVLNVADRADGASFTENDLAILQLLAEHTATCLAREDVQGELRRLAETDPLTGLPNRRHFDDRLRAELSRAERYDYPVTLLIMDLNRFKEINDKYGHSIGDLALREAGRAIAASLRQYDLPGRLGGDEFAVILPGTSIEGAWGVATRIAHAVAHAPGYQQAGVPPLSISVGISSYPRPACTMHELIEQADRAMYLAKVDPDVNIRVWEAVGPHAQTILPTDRPGRGEMLPVLANVEQYVSRRLAQRLSPAQADELESLPVRFSQGVLTVAMPNPTPERQYAVSRASGLPVLAVRTTPEDFARGLARFKQLAEPSKV
jgi:diguanylate cyclase (GGDEF)-like protein